MVTDSPDIALPPGPGAPQIIFPERQCSRRQRDRRCPSNSIRQGVFSLTHRIQRSRKGPERSRPRALTVSGMEQSTRPAQLIELFGRSSPMSFPRSSNYGINFPQSFSSFSRLHAAAWRDPTQSCKRCKPPTRIRLQASIPQLKNAVPAAPFPWVVVDSGRQDLVVHFRQPVLAGRFPRDSVSLRLEITNFTSSSSLIRRDSSSNLSGLARVRAFHVTIGMHFFRQRQHARRWSSNLTVIARPQHRAASG